tara:strand:- start:750 stop:1289 length:540 start_codon:yes stop_codon:yes gene_type:complete
MKDREVLEKVSQGDEKALEYLYKKHYKMMTRLVINNNGSEDEAKDIYQEALVAFWQKAIGGNLVLTSKISTYLYSVCLNLWRKELDRKGRFAESDKEELTFQEFEKKERVRIIHECIAELGDTCRKILTYHYFDGMSMTDIAKKLNLANTDTAKTKKYKCKKKLDLLIKRKYSSSDFLD